MADDIDPCAEAVRLRQKLSEIATGEAVSSSRFGNDEAKFAKADVTELKKLIAHYERECAISKGETPKRTRYAMAARMRPH
ncbi:gpW protein [Fulvimarina manganoxydans]|uniref:GpW protein n=1 Tax=Fulvimarina manganoxydans TaxID=937218 RepID=A0A1W1Z3D0_9HYPH|nr:hypothetical protein [Fulvimarina manganoxydans]SMC42919.1 gpW protein [Fulvimarina manganoxydans]